MRPSPSREKAKGKDADFGYRIWNADGGEVEQCGNGALCFVRFVVDEGLTIKKEIRVETKIGVIVPRLELNGEVSVTMGIPVFDPKHIPFTDGTQETVQPLDVGGETVEITAVSMGNPHAVQIISDVDTAPVTIQGPLIENHPRFPQRVNAGYMQVVSRKHVRLRVWERGIGETLACGTGACAAVAAGIRRGLLDRSVTVSTRGGELTIRWDDKRDSLTPVHMTGPSLLVFSGVIDLR